MMGKINKKIALGVLALLSVIICVAISSFIPFTFSLETIKTKKFITNELLIAAIVIISMVSTIFIGQASNAQNECSRLAKARAAFFLSVDKITNISAFYQWVKEVLQPNDIHAIYERKLKELGIEDFTVLDLEIDEIEQLLNKAGQFNDKHYKGLSKEQIKLVKNIKHGKYKVNLVDPSYYITVKNISGNRTVTEKASKEMTKKSAYLTYSVISKLTMTIVTSCIFASLAKDVLVEQEIAESLMTFGSRMFSMISSAFMGYLVGCQINDIDAEYIEMRSMVHNQFLQDKTFTPKTIEEIAKEEYEKQQES